MASLLHTFRLSSARAVAIAWVVLALVGALLLSAAFVGSGQGSDPVSYGSSAAAGAHAGSLGLR